MSEKKLRDLAKAWTLTITGSQEPGWNDAFSQALADDPDVAKVLRELDALSDIVGLMSTTGAVPLNMIRNYITERFSVRLTDDGGYEYTEPSE